MQPMRIQAMITREERGLVEQFKKDENLSSMPESYAELIRDGLIANGYDVNGEGEEIEEEEVEADD